MKTLGQMFKFFFFGGGFHFTLLNQLSPYVVEFRVTGMPKKSILFDI